MITLYTCTVKYMYTVLQMSFEVQCTCTSLTVVNGGTVIVCKLNNVRYSVCIG